MKLYNKKTGEIGQIGYVATSGGEVIVEDISGDEYPYSIISSYKTLAELNEEWEDYKPAEPLIKDEKIRKAVRAWAEAVGLENDSVVFLDGPDGHYSISRLKAYNNPYTAVIEFGYKIGGYEIEHYKDYTIAELCGDTE